MQVDEEEDNNRESELITFMKSNKQLSVGECIKLFMNRLKEEQWKEYEENMRKLNDCAQNNIKQV